MSWRWAYRRVYGLLIMTSVLASAVSFTMTVPINAVLAATAALFTLILGIIMYVSEEKIFKDK